MQLPLTLRAAIETAAARATSKDLHEAAAALSARYRAPQPSSPRFINSEAERLAYAATRMPATYAAARQVFAEVQRLWPEAAFGSLLDLGAGTGAASWAAVETFAALRQCALLEQDGGLIQLGKELAQASAHAALRAADWRLANLARVREWPNCALAVCAYALGELELDAARRLVRALWPATQQALVILEPGTLRGFATVRALREELIAAGAHLLAPCPHARACPLPENDWCHFAARVERSALQRRLKAGTLGYEDEKFAYAVFAKQPVAPVAARVLRHPLRAPGRTELRLCAVEGLQQVAVTKRDKEAWRRARKADWGDGWEL